ncbi:hypothetical protein HCN51_32245 [Nonomuraea sp. FMUSA5-5]|uniref:Uncharacterized protein n=1 Tax=Nonomuraea composti TaxID=2720023 RepID=A0ABX1BG13_9ACTN|nr:hypothetical protein [Nonomuraea sp. FMUSA5-5]NJP94053.1 hypothetical protein [Nonomuraea sp. FMUSA5-5]
MTHGSRKPLREGDGGPYVRFQVRYYGRLGVPVGIFAACHHLRRAGRLTPADDRLFTEVDGWFIARLPYPPFYADGNTVRAVPWFKPGAAALIAALAPLEDLLRRYAVPYDVVRSPDPGTIIYEDEFQIGVLPYVRRPAQVRKASPSTTDRP